MRGVKPHMPDKAAIRRKGRHAGRAPLRQPQKTIGIHHRAIGARGIVAKGQREHRVMP